MRPPSHLFTQKQMRQEILESHKRSLHYGICKERRNPNQKKLTPEALQAHRLRSRNLLEVTSEYIDEFYELVSPDQFMIAVVDPEGYILTLAGSDSIQALFAQRNCAPGYRFTERDVGTAAISLCLRIQVPVQINDQDHFCKQAHGFTSSAAPIFGKAKRLQGVLVVSGASDLVHPHTLIMVASAARSIEKQIRLVRRNTEMSIYSGFLGNVLESAGTGLLTVDNEMRVWKANRRAKRVFDQEDLDGMPIAVLKGLDIDLDAIYRDPDAWKEREGRIQYGERVIHLVYSAQPVISANGQKLGAVLVFEEFGNIRKIADKILSGAPYFTFDHLIGASPAFRESKSLARRAGQSHATVLLLGETGTGKELFAQAIHNAGPLKTEPFVPINCAAIPGELMESELFGYVQGAFSGALKGGRPGKFELAQGGTLLLDEIGDMPYRMQAKMLRVLQTGEVQRIGDSKMIKVNARIIAATNMNLLDAVSRNRFRQDLYYRLNIFPITIPPLRDRGPDDIVSLSNYFVQKYNPHGRLSAAALDALKSYHWPGNVRELENTIQRALHVCDADQVTPECLGLPNQKAVAPLNCQAGSLREMERAMIAATLEQTAANMAETAKILGISRATLYRKVKAFQISV